ncbi:MAG: hypothetical protein LBJ17_03410, partial [Dysgonamonadaceae bacterium]|nr:hypothetical protein [Dysgonamonadaceae bacterium]
VDGDFIKLDTKPSDDNNVTWTSPDNGSIADMNTEDANYQVSGTATSVSGTVAANGYIYFRIGLTSVNENNSPPRYGRILLSYNGNSKQQFLYIRQGEEADYVFRKEDTYGSSSTAREKAVKFSPYNLTAPELPDGSPYYKDIDVNGGEFVDYPTQMGAFFQFANNTNKRRAYHPITDNFSSVWNNTYNDLAYYWESSPTALKTDHETCPVNWRRPNDGITDNAQGISSNGNIAVSEMRQSLYAVPKEGVISMTENTGCAWGYYADGYFDRRAIVSSVGVNNVSKSAVSVSTKDAAYIGTLFFNSTNGNRSLFAPAGGARVGNIGSLYYSGNYGFYWSSSSNSYETGWHLGFKKGVADQSSDTRSYGCAVRCVKE